MPNKTTQWKRNFPQTAELEKKVEQAKYIIGLDLHKKTVALTIYKKDEADSKNGKIVFQRKRLLNIELLPVIKGYKGNKVVLCEAAFGWQVAQKAFRNLDDVCFVPLDPRKVCAWAQSSGIKNDRIDSESLTYSVLKGDISRLAIYQTSEQSQENFKIVTIRESMIKQRTAAKNQLKRLKFDYGENVFTGEIPKTSERINMLMNELSEQIKYLNHKIKLLDKEIENISNEDSVIKLLRNIPGIGPLTSFALRTKIDDISRFESSKHLCSYFGLAIREHQSGDQFVKGKISKTGNSLIRKYVVQCSKTIKIKKPEYYGLFFPNLVKEHPTLKQCNKLTIAVARKLLTFAYNSWTRKTPFNIEKYSLERSKDPYMAKTAEPVGELAL